MSMCTSFDKGLLEFVFFSLRSSCSVLTENVYRDQGEYEGGEVGEDAQEVNNVHRSFYKPGRMMFVMMMMWERNLLQGEKVLSVCLTSGFVYLFDNCWGKSFVSVNHIYHLPIKEAERPLKLALHKFIYIWDQTHSFLTLICVGLRWTWKMMIVIISMVDMTSFAQGQLMTFFSKVKISNLTTYSKENHPTKTASAISKKYSSSEDSCKLFCVSCVVGKNVFLFYILLFWSSKSFWRQY